MAVDGAFQQGVAPSYAETGNGTTTDTLTGLQGRLDFLNAIGRPTPGLRIRGTRWRSPSVELSADRAQGQDILVVLVHALFLARPVRGIGRQLHDDDTARGVGVDVLPELYRQRVPGADSRAMLAMNRSNEPPATRSLRHEPHGPTQLGALCC
jgi:hypothetical protein